MDSDVDHDDWLFDSIKKYKKLYMYELQKPVQASDWLTPDRLVVSISDGRRHELLELSLPAQLCVEEENTCPANSYLVHSIDIQSKYDATLTQYTSTQEGLTKDRDFQLMSGGFSDSCVTSLLHLPHTRKLVGCIKGDNSVETWQLKSDDQSKNIIERTSIISNKSSTCHSSQLCLMDNSQLMFGSHLSDLCVADLNTHSVISHTQENGRNSTISNMMQHDSHVLTSDKQTGELYLVDPREGVLKAQQLSDVWSSSSVSNTWTLVASNHGEDQGVLQVSSSGTICIRDCRNLRQCVKTLQTNLKSSGQGQIQSSICPTNPDLLAVTGFSGCVHLYDRRTWGDGGLVAPVFIHEGHMAEKDDPSLDITTNTHIWYPWKRDTLLSASNDGGLHIFQPVL